MIKILLDSIDMSACLDSYEEGQLGSSQSVMYEHIGKLFDSVDEVIEYVNKNYSLDIKQEDIEIDNNLILWSFTATNDNIKATEQEMKLWKQGKLNLYDVDITMEVQLIKLLPDSTLEELNKTHKIKDTFTNEIEEHTLLSILNNILNEGRSSDWVDYNEADWKVGLNEFTDFVIVD